MVVVRVLLNPMRAAGFLFDRQREGLCDARTVMVTPHGTYSTKLCIEFFPCGNKSLNRSVHFVLTIAAAGPENTIPPAINRLLL